MRTRWMTAVLVAIGMTAGSAWADKRLDDAVAKAEEQLRKAQELMRKNQPGQAEQAAKALEDAVKTIRKAADQDPQNPAAQLVLGSILLRTCGTDSCTAKRDAAGAAFDKAASLAGSAPGPLRAQVFIALAQYELMRGSSAKALSVADSAVKAEASVETLALLARAQARVADPAVAHRTAERGMQMSAAAGSAHEAMGAALLALGRPADAAVSLRKAVELTPAATSAQVSLALALLQDNKGAAALEVARTAVRLAPQSAEALAVQGLATAKANPNDWGTAIADAQQGAFVDAKSPLVQWAIGQLFEQNNNSDQAMSAYQAAIGFDPGFCPAAGSLAQATFRWKGKEAALTVAEKLAPANSYCGGVQLTLGEILLRKEDYAKALPALEKAAKLLPRSPDVNYFLGMAYTYLGQIPEAVAPYGKAVELKVELKEDALDYRTAYGLALARAQETDEALKVLNGVVDAPGYKKPDAWVNYGYVLRMMRRAPEAVDAYQKALSIDPKNAPAALGLALSLGQAKRCDDAVPAFRKAMELDPNAKADSLIQIARCVVMKQFTAKPRDIAAAEQAYKEALAVAGPDNPTLQAVARNLDILVKTPSGATPGVEVEEIDVPRHARCVMNSNKCPAGERVRSIGELKKAGRDGAPYIAFALRVDPEPSVRNTARAALESLKGAACGAGGELKLLARMECPSPCVNCPPAEVKRELELCDSINAGRALGQRLVSTCGVK